MLKMYMEAEEEMSWKSDANTKQTVNKGTEQVEKVSLCSFCRRWPSTHYILDSPAGGPNDALLRW